MTGTSPTRPTRPTILLLEDSDIDAELITLHLDRAGDAFDVRRVARRSEFEQALTGPPLDLILSDYSLPDFDGVQALALARSRWPGVPFVFVSGVGGEEVATDALRRGATDYVLKRSLERLVGAIRRALGEARERTQREHAEGALFRSEARMRLAVDAAELGLWQYSAHDATLAWDERCQRMFGAEGLQQIGYDDFIARVLPDDREALQQAIEAALHGDANSGLTHECRSLAADGTLRWIVMRGQKLASDIDDDARATGPADEAPSTGGADPARLTGNSSPSRVTGRSNGASLTGRSHGASITGSSSRARLTGSSSQARLTGVLQDVSATRRLEARQRQTEMLFRIAAQATGVGIWEIGPGADEVWFDESYRAMAALPPGDSPQLAQLMREVVHPDDRDRVALVVHAALASQGELEVDLEHRLIRKTDGVLRWVAVKGRRIVGIDGLPRLVGTVRDVTEQRALQQALRDANEALEQRVLERTRELVAEIAERNKVENTLRQMQRLEAVGQLTSGVAHDFNNLLTVVLSNITLIERMLNQQPQVEPRVLTRLASMRTAANRGATLTRQLLAFSRRQRLEPQAVDFNEIVTDMRDLLQTTLGGSVNLQTELDGALWPALVDPTQIEMVILNLAINARDAMEVGGSLTVRTANESLARAPERPGEPEPGDYVVLSVADTGSGMTSEVLAKAFEPFFTTKEVGKGSGLGLAQVYGFAQQSGGGVRIDTAAGRGTTVHVFLPRSAAGATLHENLPAAPAHAADPRLASSRTLLLVDDDDGVREATAALLTLHGFEIAEASDGPSALACARARPDLDAVIADFAMPRMNGAELARHLHALRPELPVLFMTGFAELGALDDVPEEFVLPKPIAENELVERLHRLFTR